MSHTRLNTSSNIPSGRKLVARNARVKNGQCTAELAEFLRATAPSLPGPHFENDQQPHEFGTGTKCSDLTCEGPSAWQRKATSAAMNMRQTQRCRTEPATFKDITASTIPSRKTKTDLTSYSHIEKILSLVPEKLRRAVRTVKKPGVLIKQEEMFSFDSSVDPSMNAVNIHNHQMLHKAIIRSSILHGAFDIPQQYFLRDKFESNNPMDTFPRETEEYNDVVSLCSHTSTESHHGSCRMLSLARRYFTLDNSGHVRQYASTMSDAPPAEEMFQTNANSIVVATDAVPGRLWCLRLSNYDNHDAHLQELPYMERNISAGPEKALSIITKDMIIVFNDSKNFATWMFAIKELVEKLKRRSRFSYLRQRRTSSSLSSLQDSGYPLVSKKRSNSPDNENAHPFAANTHRRHQHFDTDVDSLVSRCEHASGLHGQADRISSTSGDKNESIDGSSVHTVTESSTIETNFPITSAEGLSYNTSLQHYPTERRTSLEDAIRHSPFELPVKSPKIDLTDDDQSADSADIISHSLFERHASIVEDGISRCFHLLPSAAAKELAIPEPIPRFELPSPLYAMKMTPTVCEHEIDPAVCPGLAWTVDEEDSTCRTLTVAPSCPPKSPSGSAGSQSSAGSSTWDFPLPPKIGKVESVNVPKKADPGFMSTLVTITQEQAPRSSSSGNKNLPSHLATAKCSLGSPIVMPARHEHPRRHSHTDSPRTTACPVLHVSLPTASLALLPSESVTPLLTRSNVLR